MGKTKTTTTKNKTSLLDSKPVSKSTESSIQSTRDYSMFNAMNGNRLVDERHVRALSRSISETGVESLKKSPIIVNEDYQVIDGQHRLAAARDLGYPVYYIVVAGLTLKDVQSLNSITKLWNTWDYAQSWISRGNEHYEKYEHFRTKYKTSHTMTSRYLAGGREVPTHVFRTGKFKVTDEENAVKYIEQLDDIKDYYKNSNLLPFVRAYHMVASNPNYVHSRFVNVMKTEGHNILETREPVNYARQLAALFNHGIEDSKKIKIVNTF